MEIGDILKVKDSVKILGLVKNDIIRIDNILQVDPKKPTPNISICFTVLSKKNGFRNSCKRYPYFNSSVSELTNEESRLLKIKRIKKE